MRKAIITPIVASVIGIGMLAAPLAAHAGTGTATSFSLSGGMLTLTAANSEAGVALTGDTVGASSVSGQLGLVTVTDNQGDNLGWTASVTATTFTAGTDSNVSTIPVTSISYASGDVTGAAGDSTPPTFAPGSGTFADVSTPVTAATATGGTGSSQATFTPPLTVQLPAYGQQANTYAGTITQSVA